MFIKVKYMAIKMDNYQGDSGMPFIGEEYLNVSDHISIIDAVGYAEAHIKEMHASKLHFCEQHNISSIEIVKEVFTENKNKIE